MFLKNHALDVALPSAILLVEKLHPKAKGKEKDRLVSQVADFIFTTIMAYCEFHPVGLPGPSRN